MDQQTDAVSLFAAQTRPLCDLTDSSFPSVLYGWGDESLSLGSDATHYGFVQRGSVSLNCGGHEFRLTPGMYFSVPGDCRIEGAGSGFVASRIGYRGLFQLGGPIESTGRLRYIDGCSDTLLIGPAVKGDPCLNLLHIPPHTQQTAHTHPTVRFGMIVGGQGVCRSPNQALALQPGMIFSIRPEGIHSFNTTHDPLLVIAWHPDSDCGPTHGDHPMINRTVIDGVSAAQRQRNRQAVCTAADVRS
ncbi:MAG: cupin domain-containing protein [Phycisphaera sp. RhM]|nr:cupin domain-containing protein [Phycisphaera sp. RhM]